MLNKKSKENTYQHKFAHYSFECEIHPEDPAEELEKSLDDLHLSK